MACRPRSRQQYHPRPPRRHRPPQRSTPPKEPDNSYLVDDLLLADPDGPFLVTARVHHQRHAEHFSRRGSARLPCWLSFNQAHHDYVLASTGASPSVPNSTTPNARLGCEASGSEPGPADRSAAAAGRWARALGSPGSTHPATRPTQADRVPAASRTTPSLESRADHSGPDRLRGQQRLAPPPASMTPTCPPTATSEDTVRGAAGARGLDRC